MEKYINNINILSYNKTTRKLEMICTSCNDTFFRHQSTYKNSKSTICKSCNNKLIAVGNRTHNLSKSRIYNIWCGMRDRCINHNNKNFYRYGGRGIAVNETWHKSFESFNKWALENGYSQALSIDRINNDGNYEPSNCRWVTQSIQCINQGIRKDNKLNEKCIHYDVKRKAYIVQVQRNGKRKSFSRVKLDDAISIRDEFLLDFDE